MKNNVLVFMGRILECRGTSSKRAGGGGGQDAWYFERLGGTDDLGIAEAAVCLYNTI
jgi:hypothetical protein